MNKKNFNEYMIEEIDKNLAKGFNHTGILDYVSELQRLADKLQQENKELKELLQNNSKVNVADHKYANTKEDEVIELQSRIDKAIEYINSQKYEIDYGEIKVTDCCCDGFKLLSILKGEKNG